MALKDNFLSNLKKFLADFAEPGLIMMRNKALKNVAKFIRR